MGWATRGFIAGVMKLSNAAHDERRLKSAFSRPQSEPCNLLPIEALSGRTRPSMERSYAGS